MPLTRGKKAEQVPFEMAVGSDRENGDSGEEIASEQERTSRGKDPTEFIKWKLQLEMRAKAEERLMELEMRAKAEERAFQMEKERMALEMRQREMDAELEKERMAFEIRRLELEKQNNNNNGGANSEGSQLSKADLKKFPVLRLSLIHI